MSNFAATPLSHSFVTDRFALTLPEFPDPADVGVLNVAFEKLDTFAAHLALDNTFTGTTRFEATTYLHQPVTLSAHPSNAMDAATKAYADGTGGGPSFPLRGPLDSQAAPNYSFAASTVSGLNSPGTNRLGFSTHSIQRWEINADGLLIAGAACGIELPDPGTSGPGWGLRFGTAATSASGASINMPNNRGIGWNDSTSFPGPIPQTFEPMQLGCDSTNALFMRGFRRAGPRNINSYHAQWFIWLNGTLYWTPLYDSPPSDLTMMWP